MNRRPPFPASSHLPRFAVLFAAALICVALAVTFTRPTRAGHAAPAGHLARNPRGSGFRIVHFFNGPPDGGIPYQNLLRDAQGNLYGVTTYGGISGCIVQVGYVGCGTVYMIDPQDNETVLHRFIGREGTGPNSTLLMDAEGNLYGALEASGNGGGAIFKLAPDGDFTDLFRFCSRRTCFSGNGPQGALIRDARQNIYGTTAGGGLHDLGALYKLDPLGHESVLSNFGIGGSYPLSGVTPDRDWNFYGTASFGGPDRTDGTVFRISSTGHFALLYAFTGGADGSTPAGGVTLGPHGELYGTATYGGVVPPDCPRGCGVVFKIDPVGGESTLHTFTGGSDGSSPYGTLLLAADGTLYGTTYNSGANNLGTIFAIDPDGNETVLYNFTSLASHPFAGLTPDGAGHFYGTASTGGRGNCGDATACGAVFEFTP